MIHQISAKQMKKYLLFLIPICLLSFGSANCSPLLSLDNKFTQYIVAREEDKKIRPIAKVVYKVSVERQEVVYWIEFPEKPRPQIYKIKNCIVADVKNWEGEAEVLPPWSSRVKFIDGKFSNTGRDFLNVSWWSWHFETEPKPTFFSNFLAKIRFIFLVMVMSGGVIFIVSLMNEKLNSEAMKIAGRHIRTTERRKYFEDPYGLYSRSIQDKGRSF